MRIRKEWVAVGAFVAGVVGFVGGVAAPRLWSPQEAPKSILPCPTLAPSCPPLTSCQPPGDAPDRWTLIRYATGSKPTGGIMGSSYPSFESCAEAAVELSLLDPSPVYWLCGRDCPDKQDQGCERVCR